jgi:acetolactate synthase I/III small subunit
MLIKVRTDQSTRASIIQTVELFRAAVIDVGTETLTVQATGNADKLQALLAVLEPFGVKELVQSGHIGIARGSRSMTDRALRTA